MIDADLITLVHHYLSDRATGWSVAVFGAIAEFQAARGHLREVSLKPRGGSIIAQDGAIRIDLAEDVRFVPYEILTKRRGYWLQGANFCLPQEKAALESRSGLTEIGPDRLAIRERDRGAILFDLGLGLSSLQAMVRVSDPELTEALRGYAGVNLLSPEGHDAFALLIRESPHRVFRSRLGRVEVYSPIPAPDADATAALLGGAHTHILPDLLKAGRTHAANVPVPDGMVPCFQMFPPNPILAPDGSARLKLSPGRHSAFQALLQRYGLESLNTAKQRALDAMMTGAPPMDPAGMSRAERTAIRIALRQFACQTPYLPALRDWQTVFERAAPEDDEADDGQ